MSLEWVNENNVEVQKDEDNVSRYDYIKTLPVRDIVMLARYTYVTTDDPLLTDQEYDYYLSLLDDGDPLLNQNYEDDILTDSLKNHLRALDIPILDVKVPEKIENMQLRNYWGENKSIKTLKSFQEILDLFLKQCHDIGVNKIIASYKMDGWNISAYYIPGTKKCVYAHTRGKNGGKIWDVTTMMNELLPEVDVTTPTKVVMELCLRINALEELRKIYTDKKFVNARNSISSFVSGNIDIKYVKPYLQYFAFSIEGLGVGPEENMESMFKKLESLGFETPMYGVINDISQFFERFKEMEKYYEETYSKEFLADGIVVAVAERDNRDYIKSNGSNFSSGMVALKAGYWGAHIFDVEIEEIYYDENKSSFTPKARVRPVKSKISNTLRNVNLNNLNRVREDWICPGDIIRISYHSEQIVKYICKLEGQKRPEKN